MSLRMCVSVPMSVCVGVWMSSLSRMRPSLVGSAADDVPHSAKLPGCRAAMVHPQPHQAVAHGHAEMPPPPHCLWARFTLSSHY